MTENYKPWYTQPFYSMEQILLLAQATNDREALKYYNEQMNIKKKDKQDD